MFKKRVKFIFIFFVITLYASEVSEIDKLISENYEIVQPATQTFDEKKRAIAQDAVKEAIACLEQLQNRLLQDVVHLWIQGLQEYLQKLLIRDIDI